MHYDGVAAYKGQPQQFRGETGAQSSVLYAFDAALGIRHERDAMRAYLLELRAYMPVQDRACIAQLERGPSIRDYVYQHRFSAPALREAYNESVQALAEFRRLHLDYAARYILQPGRDRQNGPGRNRRYPFHRFPEKALRADPGPPGVNLFLLAPRACYRRGKSCMFRTKEETHDNSI